MGVNRRWVGAGLVVLAGLGLGWLLWSRTIVDSNASGNCTRFVDVAVQVQQAALGQPGDEPKSWATVSVSAEPAVADLGNDIGIKLTIVGAAQSDVSATFAGFSLVPSGTLHSRLSTSLDSTKTVYTLCARAGAVPSKAWARYDFVLNVQQGIGPDKREQKLRCDPTIINDASAPGPAATKTCRP